MPKKDTISIDLNAQQATFLMESGITAVAAQIRAKALKKWPDWYDPESERSRAMVICNRVRASKAANALWVEFNKVAEPLHQQRLEISNQVQKLQDQTRIKIDRLANLELKKEGITHFVSVSGAYNIATREKAEHIKMIRSAADKVASKILKGSASEKGPAKDPVLAADSPRP